MHVKEFVDLELAGKGVETLSTRIILHHPKIGRVYVADVADSGLVTAYPEYAKAVEELLSSGEISPQTVADIVGEPVEDEEIAEVAKEAVKVEEEPDVIEVEEVEEPPVKKRRGRPRKNPLIGDD